MKKTVEVKPEHITKKKDVRANIQAYDIVQALIETEFHCSDAVGILREETSEHLREAWSRAQDSVLPNITGLPSTAFQSPSRFSTIDQLTGIASSGHRVGCLMSGVRLPLPARPIVGVPFVLHLLSCHPAVYPGDMFFQLIARNPQQTADLCLIAHRLAEMSLCPGILLSDEGPNLIVYERVQQLDQASMRSYLGLPGEAIESPTSFQRSLFGKKRRRIPELYNTSLLNQAWQLIGDIFHLCQETMHQFENLTGRSYGLVEEFQTADANIVVIATGKTFDTLVENIDFFNRSVGFLHPTLLFPFPGHRLSQIVKGKKAVVLITDHSHPERDPILQEIRISFDKAIANGQYRGGLKSALPFPDHEVYARIQDRPRLYTCYQAGDDLNLEALNRLLKSLEKKSVSTWHFDLPSTEYEEDEIVEKTRQTSKRGLRLIYRAADAHTTGRHLAERLSRFFNFQFKVSGKHGEQRVYIDLHSRVVPCLPIATQADGLLLREGVPHGLETDLTAMKESGFLLIQGSPESAEKIWGSLSETCRALIQEKKLKLFLLNPLRTKAASVELPDNQWADGAFFGGFLKIASLVRTKGIKKSQLDAALHVMASNCDYHFAEAVNHGMAVVKQVDYTGLSVPPQEVLPGEDTFLIREAVVDESLATGEKPEENLKHLLTFHLTGKDTHNRFSSISELRLVPVLLYAFRGLHRVRYNYPICLIEDEPEKFILPLTQIIDGLIEETAGEGDEGERFKRDVLRLEAKIKTLVDRNGGRELEELWQEAVDSLLSDSTLDDKRRDSLRQNLLTARKALKVRAKVLSCHRYTVVELVRAIWRHIWIKRSQSFLPEVDELILKLTDILSADFNKSSEAKRAENLEASIGTAFTEEMDFETLSRLLTQTLPGDSLPSKRRERIQKILYTLTSQRSLYCPVDGNAMPGETKLEPFYPHPEETGNCMVALGRVQAWMRTIVEFFKAIHIARLEIANKYREDKHDRFFDEFNWDHLTAEERELCPPLLIYLSRSVSDEVTRNAIIDALTSGFPVKVLLLVDDPLQEMDGPDRVGEVPWWCMQLSSMAMGLHNVFVLQAAVSDVLNLVAGIQEGLSYDGPALFCVYSGASPYYTSLSPYLVSAAAGESRAFPAFLFHPGRGNDWATRFTIEANPQFDRDWPVSELIYRNSEGKETSITLPFTLVDFLAGDRRFTRHFRLVPPHLWHENMIPLHEYLSLNVRSPLEKVPYILMVNQDGVLHRVVVTRKILNMMLKWGAVWRSIQELGGVNNSHALNLLKEEKNRLEAEKQREIEDLERKYREELDRSVEDLAKEIIADIAAGLLSQEGVVKLSTELSAAPPIVPAAEEKTPDVVESPPEAEAPAEAVEEEEEVSFEEPYIETPRCTTCNECTNINALMFAYNENKQAYIKDATAGTYRELVMAAEKCPVKIIHPGKPKNPDEPGLDELMKRAEPFR